MKCRVLKEFQRGGVKLLKGSVYNFSQEELNVYKGMIEPLQHTSISSSDNIVKDRMVKEAINRGYN